jgi:hypothetical protein
LCNPHIALAAYGDGFILIFSLKNLLAPHDGAFEICLLWLDFLLLACMWRTLHGFKSLATCMHDDDGDPQIIGLFIYSLIYIF